MIELYCFLSLVFLMILWYVAWEDWKNKLISLRSFYLLNILGLVWLFFVDKWVGKWLLIVYFVLMVIFEILELLNKRPRFLSKERMIGNTGFFDYWFYLFVIALFVDFLPIGFMRFYLWFTGAIIVGGLLGYLVTKKRYDKAIPLYVYAFFILVGMIGFICLHL